MMTEEVLYKNGVVKRASRRGGLQVPSPGSRLKLWYPTVSQPHHNGSNPTKSSKSMS